MGSAPTTAIGSSCAPPASPAPTKRSCSPTGATSAFSPTSTGTAEVDAFHRCHAVVELAIRDMKDGAGMAHVPLGNFSANSACLL